VACCQQYLSVLSCNVRIKLCLVLLVVFWGTNVIFILCLFGCAYWCPTHLDYMNSMAVVLWEVCTAYRSWVHTQFLVGSLLVIFLVFCVVFFVLFAFVLCRVYPIMPVSLDCPFLIARSVFPNIYLIETTTCIICSENNPSINVLSTWYSVCKYVPQVYIADILLFEFNQQSINQSMGSNCIPLHAECISYLYFI
jgi:hypothetical protein